SCAPAEGRASTRHFASVAKNGRRLPDTESFLHGTVTAFGRTREGNRWRCGGNPRPGDVKRQLRARDDHGDDAKRYDNNGYRRERGGRGGAAVMRRMVSEKPGSLDNAIPDGDHGDRHHDGQCKNRRHAPSPRSTMSGSDQLDDRSAQRGQEDEKAAQPQP